MLLTPLFEQGEVLLPTYLALSELLSQDSSGGEGRSKDFDFAAVFVPKVLPGEGIAPNFPQFLGHLMENNAVNLCKPGRLALQVLSHNKLPAPPTPL